MKAALLDSTRHITLIDAPLPAIHAPGQMLVQVKAVGICGSEIHAYDGTHPWRKPPVVMGHELAGVVVEVGPEVQGFKKGDRVIVDPQWTCGVCPECTAGDTNLCLSKVNLGTDRWPGAFGKMINAPQEITFHLPDSLSFIQGAMVEPLSIAVHVARRAGFAAGKSIAILGTGSIGGMVSAAARAHGMSPIIGADIRQHCLDVSRERMGLAHDLLLPDPALVSRVKELTGGRGVDIAVVAADDVTLVNRAIEMVKPRGVIALVALLTEAPLQMMAYDLLRKEIDLIGCYQANHEDIHRALELAISGAVDVEGIVTHVLPIEQAQHGCELASTKADQAVKVVLTFDE